MSRPELGESSTLTVDVRGADRPVTHLDETPMLGIAEHRSPIVHLVGPWARTAVVCLSLTAVALAPACGNGGDGPDFPTAASGGRTTDRSVPGPIERETLELDASVHFAGFEITPEQAVLEPAEAGMLGSFPTVAVTASAENLVETSAQIPSFVYLDVDGRVSRARPTAEFGDIAAGSTAEVEFVFEVDEDFESSDAVLRFGGDGTAAATVPFDEAADPVTLDPVDLDLAGALEVGDLSFAVESGQARFDRLDLHQQAEDGKAYIVIEFGVTFNGEVGGPSYPFGDDETRLNTPDGATLAPIEFPNALLRPGSTTSELMLIFEIQADGPGDYELVGVHLPGFDDEASAELVFEVPDLEST
jgi:hypothetical protein